MLRIERGRPTYPRTQLLLPRGQGERTIADTGTYYVVERLSEGHASNHCQVVKCDQCALSSIPALSSGTMRGWNDEEVPCNICSPLLFPFHSQKAEHLTRKPTQTPEMPFNKKRLHTSEIQHNGPSGWAGGKGHGNLVQEQGGNKQFVIFSFGSITQLCVVILGVYFRTRKRL